MFKAEKFDPQRGRTCSKKSGAKYVVPVFEHHDGFAMYDSGLSDWTVGEDGAASRYWRGSGQGGARGGTAFGRIVAPR